MKKIGKFINMLIVTAIVINMFAPLTVLAANVDIVLTFTVDPGSNIVMQANENNLGAKLTSAAGYSFIDFNENGTESKLTTKSAICSDDTHCNITVEVPAGKGIDIRIGGDAGFEAAGNTVNITQDSSISLRLRQEEQTNDEKDNDAYLVWSCDESICYKHLEKLDEHDRVNYILDSSIEADNHAGKKFSVGNAAIVASPKKFAERKAEIDAGSVSFNSLIGSDGIDYQPLNNEPKENNAFVSYADRNFKLIIYNSKYRGIEIGNINDLHYYPNEFKDQFKRRESYDISDTTKENPVEIDTVLLEDTLTLRVQGFTTYTVESIEALDVPENAVEITKNTGSFTFKFKSNFYDKVIFKVNDSDGNSYYIYINRRTIDPYIDANKNNGKGKIVAEVFYDRETSYSDYIVLAKIQYKNGSSKVVKLTGIKYGDDGLGNQIDVIEYDEENPPFNIDVNNRGKGIKRTKYAYDISVDELKTVDKIYINVEKKGSSDTTYAGNFAGSGKGDLIDMKDWEDKL